MTWGECALCGHPMAVHVLWELTKAGMTCAGCPGKLCENETPVEEGDDDVAELQLR